MSAAPLIDPTLLFRFEVEILESALRWGKQGLSLSAEHQLPPLSSLADRRWFADVRFGWNKEGLGFTLAVTGKRQLPWCRDSRLEDSDGLHLWIDTHGSPGIHRANRYCHRFVFAPFGGGPRRDTAVAGLVPIHRARENPLPVGAELLKVIGEPTSDGYTMSGMIPARGLTGWDPSEHPQIGFWCAVADRELGWQPLTLGPEYPVIEDPTLWTVAALKSVGTTG